MGMTVGAAMRGLRPVVEIMFIDFIGVTAILGVCTIDDELAMAEGTVTVRKKLHISLTFDHRLLDGATVAQFQLAVKQLLEHPLEIVL
jgi:pyruvate dehydrogenase E2 component (dihydrolipoamide acetyltransferase)